MASLLLPGRLGTLACNNGRSPHGQQEAPGRLQPDAPDDDEELEVRQRLFDEQLLPLTSVLGLY